jgi:hypothetical protein
MRLMQFDFWATLFVSTRGCVICDAILEDPQYTDISHIRFCIALAMTKMSCDNWYACAC